MHRNSDAHRILILAFLCAWRDWASAFAQGRLQNVPREGTSLASQEFQLLRERWPPSLHVSSLGSGPGSATTSVQLWASLVIVLSVSFILSDVGRIKTSLRGVL